MPLNHRTLKETSEEPIDWEEDPESCGEDEDDQSRTLGQISDYFSIREGKLTSIGSAIWQAKLALIDRLTQEFWSILHKHQKHRFVVDVMVKSFPNPTRPELHCNLKRGHEEADDTLSCSFLIDDTKAHKRIKGLHTLPDFSETSKFACPFRKHDPRKYSVPHWGPCALTPLQTIARVKAHLYRHHRVHQCQRCKEVFESQEDLDTHVEGIEGCEAKSSQPVDGVTGKIKERLQTRKKAYPGQTEANRWEEIYQILFPDEEVPSPDFEPIRDYHGDDIQPHGSQEVANYEDYLRRELPSLFKSALESAVNHEIQPIEERMRGQMLSLLEMAQRLAFSKYMSMKGHEVSNSQPFDSEGHRNYLSMANQTTMLSNVTTGPTEGADEPPSLSPILKPGTLLSFSELDRSVANDTLRTSTQPSGQVTCPSCPGEERAPLNGARAVTPGLEYRSSPNSIADTNSSLPPPNQEILHNQNAQTNIDDGPGFNLFSEEWASSLDKLDPSFFDWSPTWDITMPTVHASNEQ